jgi:ribonucleoside-diphosphate reductase alpha chain
MKDDAGYQAAPSGQTVESSGTHGDGVDRARASAGSDRSERGEGRSRKTMPAAGLTFPRFFTEAGVDSFDEIEWDLRSAVIGNERGEVVFEQRDVEIPAFWSQQATNIVVSKYFRGQIGMAERERSVRQLIGRVVTTITDWARTQKYFATEDDLKAFSDDLKHILVYQKAAFNSPVWFNCGFEKAPQCSACFINSVQDTMDSILTLARTEGMLFKFGSGTGTNLSTIRSSKELLAGGGTASGPVSFMKGYDAFAGVIKSGGKTRRAAKMVILDADHPDIVEFINCKVEEEKKAWALIDAGYDGSFTGPAYSSVFFQNSNNSVRVTDEFMRGVLDDGVWETRAVTTGDVMDRYQARDLMRLIAEGTYVCGDPGMQFDTTINEWHTCPHTDRIYASNPCSEYMFLNDSACNLASINLMKFVKGDGEFDAVAYKAAIRTLITAQEIIVDNASYPTPSIEKNSHAYRPLGLGYANLGALLMSRGLPYDSDAGRDYAAALTALMSFLRHVDRLADRAGDERLRRAHHLDVAHVVDRAVPLGRLERAVEHRQVRLLQTGRAFDGLVAVDVVDDRLDLRVGVAELSERHWNGLVDDLHQAAADELLVLHERDVRLHAGRIAVHHEADGAGRREHRCLRVAVAVLLAELDGVVPRGFRRAVEL